MEDIHPIKPPIETPVFSDDLIRIIWLVFIIIIVATFIALALYIRKKYINKQNELEVTPEPEKIDYSKLARTKLAEVKQYLDRADYKKFHLKTSEIIKEYLSYRYDDDFVDMTSEELLVSEHLREDIQKRLEEYFKESDMIKYAAKENKTERHNDLYKLAQKICT